MDRKMLTRTQIQRSGFSMCGFLSRDAENKATRIQNKTK